MSSRIDLSFHRAAAYIEEDLEYYFSDARDKHNQIRPADDIAPCTPEAPPGRAIGTRTEHGHLFYPHPRHSIGRIFIGISFPLYANAWGAAFLRHLLELIEPDGAIILPVYHEQQAHEKGLWSRSFLENVFRVRDRFTGISNIWAENDGVMSMRVGRKWPPVFASTARALFEHGARDAWRAAVSDGEAAGLAQWQSVCSRHWQCASTSAIAEQIVREHFGAKRKVRLAVVGDDSALLGLELLWSPYIRVVEAGVFDAIDNAAQIRAIETACGTGRHETLAIAPESAACDALIALDGPPADEHVQRVAVNGLIICAPGVAAAPPEGFTAQANYSTRVAALLRTAPPIHHYSMQIEEEIAAEATGDAPSFAVWRRT